MSHAVKVRLIADSVIRIAGKDVYIHDIETIFVNSRGRITEVFLKEPPLENFGEALTAVEHIRSNHVKSFSSL